MADRNLKIRILLEAADKLTRPLRDVAAGSRKAADGLKQTRDRLGEITKAQGDVGAFRHLRGELKATDQAMQEARTRIGALAREMAATAEPTRKMTREFESAKREAAALKVQHAEQSARLDTLRDRMRAAGMATGGLVQHERDLRDASARTTAELEQQQAQLDRISQRRARFAAGREQFDSMNQRASGLAASGASAIVTGVGIAAPLYRASGNAAEFESGMTDVGQKADMGRNERMRMGDQVRAIAKLVNQFPAEMQRGLDMLSGFGIDPRTAQRMLRPIGQAATAYKAEIADLAAASFAAVDNLKVPVEQTGKVLDVMAKAGKEGAFEVKDMASSFPALTASMQSLGSSGVEAVGDLSAALQITRKGAGDSATAANNLMNLLSKINSGDTIKNFKKFGIDLPAAMKRAAKEGRSPIEEIVALTQKATGGSQVKLSQIFSDMQVQQALRPLMTNMAEYQRIRASALGANGAVSTDFADRMGDTAEKTKAAQIATGDLGTTMGQILKPVTDDMSTRLQGVSERLQGFAAAHPGVARGATIAAGGLAGLIIVLGGGALALSGIMAPFAAFRMMTTWLGTSPTAIFRSVGQGLLFLGKSAWRAGAMMLANPMILAIVAIGVALGVLAYLVWKHWDKIKAGFSGAMKWLSAMVTSFSRAGGNIIQGLVDGITGKLAAVKKAIVGAASAAIGWFKEKLGIHSPSRVFMELGGHIMGGLDLGLGGGEKGLVDRMSRMSGVMGAALALSATPALASAAEVKVRRFDRITTQGIASPGRVATGSAGAVGGGGVYNITIHAAPGMSEQDLARAVAMELDRREREKTSRTRSSFGDDPDTDSLL